MSAGALAGADGLGFGGLPHMDLVIDFLSDWTIWWLSAKSECLEGSR